MTSFGRYEILGRLGEGAMGVVYRARDATLGRVVALKMLSNETSQMSEQHQRFEREAEAIGRLNHPNIVKVYDLGNADDKLYMAMELLEGDDLRDLIAHGAPVPLADRVRIFIQICQGLGYAHKRGVVHRDVKPANIIVTATGRVKLLDFGLARVSTRKTITRRGVILGTPDYMAPEQAVGKTVTPRSDIFAAGGVFYEFLTLTKPFPGQNLHSVLYKIISDDPVPVMTLNPDVPARLAAVVHRMLEKTLEKRYNDLDDVIEDLSSIHASLRRSHSRSALPQSPEAMSAPVSDDARSRVARHISRGRDHFGQSRYDRAVDELREALAIDPDAAEASDLLWQAGRRGAFEPGFSPEAHAAAIDDLLARAERGDEDDMRLAIAELAIVAPDDARVSELLRRKRGEADP